MILQTVKVYDASSILYAGHSYGGDFNVKGVPAGGLRRLLELTCLDISDEIIPIWVFDGKPMRASMVPEYKSNRVRNPDIAIQKTMAEDIGHKLGITCYKYDEYEADDVVYNLILQLYDKYSRIRIVTGDTDLAANIISKNIDILGSASIYPNVTVHNFGQVVKSGVPYNCILPYYFFHGKASNAVKPFFKTSKENTAWFNEFIAYCDNESVALAHRSFEYYMQKFISKLYFDKRLTDDEASKWLNRCKFIYPFTIECFPEFVCSAHKIDEFPQILCALRMYSSAELLHIPSISATTQITSATHEYFNNFVHMYNTGINAIDNGTSPDMSLFANSSKYFDVDIGGF